MFVNTGTVNDLGQIWFGNKSSEAATIVNTAGAVFNLAGNDADIELNIYHYTLWVAGLDDFNNAGVLAKTSGVAISEVEAFVNNTGTITVADQLWLDLNGGANIAGTLTGKGTLVFGCGDVWISSATKIDVGTLIFAGSPLAGVILHVAPAQTLHLTGPELMGAEIEGFGTRQTGTGVGTYAAAKASGVRFGTLELAGTTIIHDSGVDLGTNIVAPLILGGGITLRNTGTILDRAEIQFGDDFGPDATIVNTAGAVFALTNDMPWVVNLISATAGHGTIVNQGLFEKVGVTTPGGTGTSDIFAFINNTGTIAITAGALELDGGGALAGTITGGALTLGGGTFTIAANTTFSVASLRLVGDLVSERTILSVPSGQQVTLNGPTINGLDLRGTGTLAVGGATSVGAIALGGGVTWRNTGAVVTTASIRVGDSAGNTATIVNAAGATFNLTGYGSFVRQGTATITNAGLLERTGAGTSAVYAAIASTGAVAAIGGTLELDCGGTLAGSIGGQGGGVVRLAGASAFTVTSILAIQDAGSGLTALAVAAGATLTDSGVINDSGCFTLGGYQNYPFARSTLAITAQGHFNLTGDNATIVNPDGGAYFGSALTNAGIIAKTGGTGASSITGAFTNSGTVDAASGTLRLLGAIGGSGRMQIEAGATLELAGGAAAGTNTVAFNGGGATLKLDSNSAVSRTVVGLGAGSRIDLPAANSASAVVNGNTLTVTPAGGGALNFISSASLGGLSIVTTGDGAAGTMVELGSATSVVALTASTRSVQAAAGARVVTTAANAGALVTGGTGGATLELTSGGTATLNAATTHVTVQLDQATNLTLGKMGFILTRRSNTRQWPDPAMKLASRNQHVLIDRICSSPV